MCLSPISEGFVLFIKSEVDSYSFLSQPRAALQGRYQASPCSP